jgi:asparagine synthase (glutamine-hydrolysing)
MAQLLDHPVNTSAIGFREDQFNELPYASLAARQFRTNHHEYVVEPRIVEVLDKLSWYFDEPFADASAVPTYYVSQMARKQVTVALSGDGGDENFAGYRRYYFDRLENVWRSCIPSWMRRSVVAGLARAYPKADWLPQIFRAKTLLTNLSLPPIQAYLHSMTAFSEAMKARLYSGDYRSMLNGHGGASDLFAQYHARAKASDPLSAIQYLDIKTYLVDDICTKVDRASMACSLEVRSPMLDHKLVEFAAGIPWHHKLRGREGKHILKEAAKSFVPPDVLCRRKMGFCLPVARWLRGELSGFTQERLEELGRRHSGLLNVECMRRMLREHHSGLRDYSTQLWALMMFQLWEQRFLSPAGSQA